MVNSLVRDLRGENPSWDSDTVPPPLVHRLFGLALSPHGDGPKPTNSASVCDADWRIGVIESSPPRGGS